MRTTKTIRQNSRHWMPLARNQKIAQVRSHQDDVCCINGDLEKTPSIRIQPHPATSQHLVIRNCIGIKWIWDLSFLPTHTHMTWVWRLKITFLLIRQYSTYSHSHAAFFSKPSKCACAPRHVLPSTNGYTQIRGSQRRSIVDASAVGRMVAP